MQSIVGAIRYTSGCCPFAVSSWQISFPQACLWGLVSGNQLLRPLYAKSDDNPQEVPRCNQIHNELYSLNAIAYSNNGILYWTHLSCLSKLGNQATYDSKKLCKDDKRSFPPKLCPQWLSSKLCTCVCLYLFLSACVCVCVCAHGWIAG